MTADQRLLELLLAGAERAELGAAEAPPEARTVALRLHEQMSRLLSREAELTALFETARDLTAIRDVDEILAAIVRRARALLHADMTYLSLNDEEEGASYMRVTDGALTPEFRRLRLPLGTGLLGLVAQTGEPYFTEDYQADQRFVHRDYIDAAVAGEHIRAILGVPLVVENRVIGALLAVHRTVRPFPPGEVALLTSFAAHAAVALQNARLFEQAARANEQLRERSEATEKAAHAHDLLTDVLLHGGGVVEVAAVLAEVLDAPLSVRDDEGHLLAGPGPDPAGLDDAVARARASGRSVPVPDQAWVAAAAAGDELLGTLVLHLARPLDEAERRTLERGALVTALVLLFARVEAEAENRVRGELLVELLRGDRDPAGLRERARRQGAELDGPLTVAVTELDDDGAAVRALTALARELRGLAGRYDDRAVLVAPGPADEVVARLRARLEGRTVGVAEHRGGIEGLPAAGREARQVLSALVRLGRAGEVSDVAGLGLARLLLGTGDPAELDELIAASLGPLLDYDAERGTMLVETLEAWLDCGGSLRDAAERLHVHPNTVTQRLDRVTALLGPDWREPRRRLELHVVAQLRALRG